MDWPAIYIVSLFSARSKAGLIPLLRTVVPHRSETGFKQGVFSKRMWKITRLNYLVLSSYQNAVLKLSVRHYFYTHSWVAGLLRVNYKNWAVFTFIMQGLYFGLFEGASACEGLHCYEDAISWSRKGLAVSFITSFMFLPAVKRRPSCYL